MIVADTVLAPTRSLSFHTFLARTSTPGVSDGQQAFHARALLLNTKWQTFAEYTDIEDNFNAEVGFVPRIGIRTTKVHIERNPRPGGWIRVMEPMFNITNTTDQHNRLLTRRIHHMVGTRFKNGAYINVMFNHLYDRLDVPFVVQNQVTIPVGEYRFHEWNFVFNSNPSRRVYALSTFSPQTFYDGTQEGHRGDARRAGDQPRVRRGLAASQRRRSSVGRLRRQPGDSQVRLRHVAAHDHPLAVPVQLARRGS